MAVIPFDPNRARSKGLQPGMGAEPMAGNAQPCPAPEENEELEQALHRTHALERLLVATLRQNAVNWARAEYASILLASRA